MTPIYNENNLPCVQSPIKIRKEQTKKYLGGYAQVGQTFVDIELAATTMSEVEALYSFWAVDCAGGTNPFLINLPVNGTFGNYLCSWVSDLNNITNSSYGNISVTLKVLCKDGEFTQDADGTYHITPTGETVYSNTLLKSINGNTAIVYLTKTDIGLGNVDNTADEDKNVLSATKLTTARTIILTGDVTGSAIFDGSDDVSITATIADDSHNHSISNITSLQSVLDSKLDVTSNAVSASKLETARTISLTGDVVGSADFDGSDNININITISEKKLADSILLYGLAYGFGNTKEIKSQKQLIEEQMLQNFKINYTQGY